jgi:hypothetical protein
MKKPKALKNADKLEAALPSLVEKLKALAETLSPDERVVFSEIIESAADHSEVVTAHDEGDLRIVYAKPKSVYSTASMKREYIKLPKTLGLKK